MPATVGSVLRLFMIGSVMLYVACDRGASSMDSSDLPHYVLTEMKDASEFEREILLDGIVTAAEYQQAVFATLQCAEEHGIGHTEPQLSHDGRRAPRYEFTVGPWPEEEDEKYTKLYKACVDEFLYGVLAAWMQQEGPSESQMAKGKDEVVVCMNEHGLQFPDFAAFEAAASTLSREQMAIFGNCWALVFKGEDRFN